MSDRAVEAPYTLKGIEAMLGLSRGVVTRLVRAGFVTPTRGPRNELRFSFRDVVLLRAAYGLRAAKVPPRTILRSLRQLRKSLPAELPLTGLRITAVGNTVAVRDGNARWEPDSGQLLIDLDVASGGGTVSVLPHRRRTRTSAQSADDWFARAQRLEGDDRRAEAEAAYRRALALDPAHADAYLNLGALLSEAGRSSEAVLLYGEALRQLPDVASLHFNLAVALEDLGDARAALASYERCIALEPRSADAHFNAARLHDQLGQMQQALRHFSAYRRLQR